MSDFRLTSESFDRGPRETLRYRHGFETKDLDRVRDILSEASAHVERRTNTSTGVSARNLDMAVKFLDEHEGWKKLPEQKRAHVMNVLKEHYGIQEEGSL